METDVCVEFFFSGTRGGFSRNNTWGNEFLIEGNEFLIELLMVSVFWIVGDRKFFGHRKTFSISAKPKTEKFSAKPKTENIDFK